MSDGLLGREDELAFLRRAVDRALGGEPTGVLVSGEAGIGKTRLAREVLGIAQARGLETRVVRCRRGDQGSAMGAALASLVAVGDRGGSDDPVWPDHAVWPDDELALALARHSRSRPLLLAVDDVQWADDATLRRLVLLGTAPAPARVVVVATERTSAEPPPTLVDELRAAPWVTSIPLGGLDLATTRRLLVEAGAGVDVLDRVESVHRRTRGNPLLIEAAASMPPGTASAPPTDVETGARRLIGRVSPNARRYATLVAVAGDGAPPALLEALLADEGLHHPAERDEALRSGLVRDDVIGPDGRRIGIAHPVLADVLVADLPAGEAARLHRRCADELAAAGADPRLVAEHLVASDAPDDRVLDATVAAGLAAGRAGDTPTAAWFFDEAWRRSDRGAAFDRRDLIEFASEACRHLAFSLAPGRAVEIHRAGLAAADAEGDLAARARLVAEFLRWRVGASDAGDDHPLDEAVELAERLVDLHPDRAASLLDVCATAAMPVDFSGRPARLADRAVAVAERGHDPDVLAGATITRGLIHWTSVELAEATARWQAVVRLPGAAPSFTVSALIRWSLSALWSGDLAAARRLAAEARATTDRHGPTRDLGFVDLVDAASAYHAGDLDEAADLLHRLDRRCEIVGYRMIRNLSGPFQATVLADAGRDDEAVRLLTALEAADARPQMATTFAAARAWLAARSGERVDAPSGAVDLASFLYLGGPALACLLVDLAWRTGRPGGTGPLTASLTEAHRHGLRHTSTFPRLVTLALAQCAQLEGRDDAALAHLGAARADAETLGSVPFLAQVEEVAAHGPASVPRHRPPRAGTDEPPDGTRPRPWILVIRPDGDPDGRDAAPGGEIDETDVRSAVAAAGGTAGPRTGLDESILAFFDDQAALHMAVHLADRGRRRVGVADASRVVARDANWFGSGVNLAARLAALARAGEALAAVDPTGPTATELEQAGLVAHPRGRHLLRGIGELGLVRLGPNPVPS